MLTVGQVFVLDLGDKLEFTVTALHNTDLESLETLASHGGDVDTKSLSVKGNILDSH
jgi:hypothetical protein